MKNRDCALAERDRKQGTESITVERLSVMIGVIATIAATVPRYIRGEHEGRLVLILVACLVVAIVALASWRMLRREARRRLPALLGRLLIMFLLGGLLTALWQMLHDGLDGLLLLSHGATLGLLIHALLVGWRPREA